MPERVLIAHPDPEERLRISTIVRTAGFDAVECADGDAAVRAARGVVIAFVAPALAGVDGLALALKLREDGASPAVVLLNDVYPASEPKEKLLRDFSLAAALVAPASTEAIARSLFSLDRSARKGRREDPKTSDLVDTPLLLLLARARRRRDTGFLYVRRGSDARFITLVRGDIALVRSNSPVATDETLLIEQAILWPTGEALFYVDSDLEATSAPRIELLPLLERMTREPLASVLVEAAERNALKATRVVFQAVDGSAEIAEATGLTLYERELLALIDGDRSVGRIAGLAELAGLPVGRLLLRLEATGVLARRRPGSPRSGVRSATAEAHSPLLPHAPVLPVESAGTLGPGGLARLLVRLEVSRATGVLAVKRDGRTVEMALRDGRITGSHAWGGNQPEEDPVARLAERSELRPDDVPFLRRLHAQKLVIEILRAADCEWTFRKGEVYRMAETLGANPGSLVAELLRSGALEPMLGGPPAPGHAVAIARAMALTRSEFDELSAWSEGGVLPENLWLRSLGSLLDPTVPVGRPLADSSRALPAAPPSIAGPRKAPADALEALFEEALDQGMRDGDRAGAPRAQHPIATVSAPPPAPARPAVFRAPSVLPPRPTREALPPLPEEDVPEDLRAFELALGDGGGRAPVSFSMEQRAGGVVIRVGDKEYAIDLLIREVEELRRERGRMRGELVNRHNLLVEREDEVESVRKTVHELENFIHELQSTLVEKEGSLAELERTRGIHDVELAEFRAVLPEKDRLLEQSLAATEKLTSDLERANGRLKEKERGLEEARTNRDSLQAKITRLDAEISARQEALRDSEERITLLKERGNRLEQDLAVARAERDDLTSRIAFQDGEKKRKGFFRDARAEKAAVDERVEKAERLADERRKALEAVQKEGVGLSHRVLDLEGQIARREADIGRNRRERERLEEKLSSAQAEAAARAESESAARARRDEAERMLSERSATLDKARSEVAELSELKTRLQRELSETRALLVSREQDMGEIVEQRLQLRARVEALESDSSRLAGELTQMREERDRFEWSLDESRQTSERVATAMAALTTARDELLSRLAETQTQKQSAEKEREHFFEESCRTEQALAETSKALATAQAELEKRDAALVRALGDAGKNAERVITLEQERDQARTRAATLDAEVTSLAAQVQAHARSLEEATTRAEQSRIRIVELESSLTHTRDELVASKLQLSQQAQRDELRATEMLALLDRLQSEKTATDDRHRAEMARRETEMAAELAGERTRSQTELATDRAAQQEELEYARQELRVLGESMQSETQAIRRALAIAEERVAELTGNETALNERHQARSEEINLLQAQLAEANQQHNTVVRKLEQTVAGEVAAVSKLERDLSHLKSEAVRVIAAWKEKVRRLEVRLEKAAADEIALRETLAAREAAELAMQAELRAAEARREESETRARERSRDADLRVADAQKMGDRHKQTVAELTTRAADLDRRLVQATADLVRRDAALSSRDGDTQRLLAAERELTQTLRAQSEQKDADILSLRAAIDAHVVAAQRFDGQMTAARKRVAQDVRRISELVALADDLKARLAERDVQLRAREAEAAQRLAEADAFREAAAQKERTLAETRESTYAQSQHDRELSQQLAEQEELISNLKADLSRLERERAEIQRNDDLRLEKIRGDGQKLTETVSALRAEVSRVQGLAHAAEIRERDARAALARQSAEAVPTGDGAGAEYQRRLRVAHSRVAELEQELAERLTEQSSQLQENDSLCEDVVAATQALDDAQGEIDRLARELDERRREDTARANRVRDLETALADQGRELAARSTSLAGREAGLAARDEVVTRLGNRIADLESERMRETATLNARIATLEQAARTREEAYALLDETLAARERMVEELARRSQSDRELADKNNIEIQRDRSAASELRKQLDQATRALEAAARHRDQRQELAQKLQSAMAERTALLSEVEALRAAMLASGTPVVAQESPASGSELEVPAHAVTNTGLAEAVAEKELLLQRSNQANGELTRLRENLDRKTAEVANYEALFIAEPHESPRRRELMSAREAADEQACALHANLGVLRVRMAEMNRHIIEKNRIIQRLMEGGATPAADTSNTPASPTPLSHPVARVEQPAVERSATVGIVQTESNDRASAPSDEATGRADKT